MTPHQARRAATSVGLFTLGAGAALAAAPEPVGRRIGVTDPHAARIIGIVDLALVPGLLRGRRRWAWAAARGVASLATAGYALAQGEGRQARAFAAGLAVATVGDTRTALALRADRP